VRAAVLALLAEEPMHGYQLMQAIADRSGGRWTPSPGAIYPTISQLEDEGPVNVTAESGRKLVAMTHDGREHLFVTNGHPNFYPQAGARPAGSGATVAGSVVAGTPAGSGAGAGFCFLRHRCPAVPRAGLLLSPTAAGRLSTASAGLLRARAGLCAAARYGLRASCRRAARRAPRAGAHRRWRHDLGLGRVFGQGLHQSGDRNGAWAQARIARRFRRQMARRFASGRPRSLPRHARWRARAAARPGGAGFPHAHRRRPLSVVRATCPPRSRVRRRWWAQSG